MWPTCEYLSQFRLLSSSCRLASFTAPKPSPAFHGGGGVAAAEVSPPLPARISSPPLMASCSRSTSLPRVILSHRLFVLHFGQMRLMCMLPAGRSQSDNNYARSQQHLHGASAALRAHALQHTVTSAQRLPHLSLKAQYLFMCIAIAQLLAGAAALLGKAVGSHSPGLSVAARCMLLIAPLSADTDLNPLIYHLLFIVSVAWTVVSILLILYVTRHSTSIAR